MPVFEKKHRILTAKEAAHILDMSPDDVTELARRGELPGDRVGRFWRFRWRDIVLARNRINRRKAK